MCPIILKGSGASPANIGTSAEEILDVSEVLLYLTQVSPTQFTKQSEFFY